MQEDFAQEEPISLGKWMLDIFLSYLPFFGVIILIIWAVGGEVSQTKKNWAIARLLWTAIVFVIAFMFWGAFIAFFTMGPGMNF